MGEQTDIIDVAIIGAGTAGLTAAVYTQRAGKHAVLFEGLTYGGQIVNTPDIENYPGIPHISGFEFATGLYNQAVNLGAELKTEAVLAVEPSGKTRSGGSAASIGSPADPSDRSSGKTCPGSAVEEPEETSGTDGKRGAAEKALWNVRTAEHTYTARTVILATGAKNRPLGVDREAELVGKGVSYCATCDGMFFRGKDVAVVGGGNTALEDAAFLANFCRTVYLIHRRDEFRGSAKEAEALREKPNVKFVLNSTVSDILGESKVEGVRIRNKVTGDISDLRVDGLFVAVGQVPANDAFANLVKLDPKGYIIADETCTTGTGGIFTAGDCRTKDVRQLTTAASDGAVAALAAVQYIG